MRLIADESEDDSDDQEAAVTWPQAVAAVRVGLALLRPYAGLAAVVLALIAIEGMFNAAFALSMRFLIDDALNEENVEALWLVLATLGSLGVSVTAAGVAGDYLFGVLSTNLLQDFRERIFSRIQKLDLGHLHREQGGKLLSLFSVDMAALESAAHDFPSWFLLPLFEVVFSIAILFWFNPWLTLIALLVVPFSLIGPKKFAALTMGAAYQKKVLEGELMGAIQDNVAAQTVIRAYGREDWSLGRFKKHNRKLSRNLIRFYFLGALVDRSSSGTTLLLHFVILGVGAAMVNDGRITIGTLVAFESTFLSFSYSLNYVTQYLPSFAEGAGALDHIEGLLKGEGGPADAPNAEPLPKTSHRIDFKKVGFRYPGAKWRVSNLTVSIPAGSFVAFVGASGAGKSTLLNLMLRFYDPASGAILIDGRDLRSYSVASIRAQIGIVFQDPLLMNLSIGDNIRLGREDASEEAVRAAAKAAEIDDFISGLPEGYGTMAGERGGLLSGGQRQRIAIARALVREPRILIFDEATSALDVETEASLMATVERIREGRTVIVVTHRLSAVANADQIFAFEDGRIVQTKARLRSKRLPFSAER
jgi:ATP-binding cassette subfamily B protein